MKPSNEPCKTQRSSLATAVLMALFGMTTGMVQANFDIPTGSSPSPLFGAQPFTQQMLMFEEFGPQSLPTSSAPKTLPAVGGCLGPTQAVTTDPNSSWNTSMDAFLTAPLWPAPTEEANTSLPNAWTSAISTCVGRQITGPLEGRPPGPNFAHQRWSEFSPEVFFQTVQTGARVNGGFRDSLQSHQYSVGEFGPGGLYHNTAGVPATEGTTKGIQIKFHPNMPVQDPMKLWTFDGTLPPKLLKAPYGTTILNRHYNALPISDAATGGFGMHTISTHEHNGHNPAESDGFAGAYFYPGQFYDYRWPMVLAGHDSINTDASDPRTGTPLCTDPRPGQCATPGQIRKIRGDWHETMSTHWFHDHMVDYTAQNVYKGNATMMNYYSAIDRGHEPANATEAQGDPATPGYGCHYADPNNVNLCLPSGSGLDWGNRDYDVNLVVADKAFDAQGQLYFNPFNTDGFLGDVMTVNFLYKPYLDVRARRYRFRILDGAVSRYIKIALVDAAGNQVPFHMIGNDGNLMEHAVPFPNVESPEGLPEQSIAERYDIVVDFSQFKEGDKLYFVNLLEHADGKSPKQAIPLAQVLSGEYSKGGCPASCDPAVGKFMELRVHAYNGTDLSMDPTDYEEGKKKMIPLPGFTAQELANAKERTFSFGRGGDVSPWTIATDGGQAYNATSTPGLFDRVTAAPEKGSVEIWHIRNGGQGWSHPVHVHFEEGQILQRGGKAPPIWEKGARKDMYRIGPLPDSTDSVDLAIRVREFLGTYVEHCHNTQHEDHAMLLRWDSQNPGQTVAIQTPYPSWDGVSYVNSNTTDVPTFKTGKATDFLTKVAAPIATNDAAGTTSGSPVTVDVLANDSCVGTCDPASVLIASAPANGAAVVNADGTVAYTPAAGFTGTDSFSYTTRDTTTGTQVSNAASVSVTVGNAPPPPAPIAVNDTATTIQDTVVGIDLTANDSNCSTGCAVAIASAPAHGTVVANSLELGQVSYSPAAGYSGTDTFTYTATNTGGTSSPAQVTVTVTANPVLDVVTISSATLKAGTLTVKGSVSKLNNAFAPSVTVYAGPANASHTACTGTVLGTAPVATKPVKSAGTWAFTQKKVTGTSVCVQSANFGIAVSPL